jgi:hypothetical protein
MGLCCTLFLSCLLCSLSLTGGEKEPTPLVKKNHLLYLVKAKKVASAIDLYQEYKKSRGEKHDSEILEQMALILLDQGMESKEEEKELISLYGASLAGVSSLLELCDRGMKSKHPTTQLTSIQMLGQIQDDRVNSLLCSAFSSEFLGIRMEAAAYLSLRKYLHAVGYIESLMNKLPPFFHCFFSEMYAQIGTNEAMNVLKKMIHDAELYTRIAATLAAAHYGRDDMLSDIRTAATHLNPAEQEACATALGMLGDSHSIELLEKMSKSADEQVQLSAHQSLFSLGKKTYLDEIKNLAKKRHLFAISSLGHIEGGEDLLCELLKDKETSVRFNAALALLERRDVRSLPTITELLLAKRHDLGFVPHYSAGRSLMHWKIIPSASAYSGKDKNNNLLAISLALREQTLTQCLELDEQAFLMLAQTILDAQQKDLIPLLMQLLSNLNNEAAIMLLKAKAEELGAPFIRNYASLALTKLKVEGPYQHRIESWVQAQKETELIRFRPLTAKTASETSFNYQLTPQENSALLVEALMLIAMTHEERGIDILLEVLKNGHPNNQPVIAGLIMKALE